MPAPTNCLECNASLSPSDTGGVCPKCLLKLGLASQLAHGSLPASAKGLRDDGSIEEPFDFGGYRILRLLGKGGMGAVYEAEQTGTGRRVALKVLGQSLDTPEMRQRFVREGQLAASVRHGNVVAVLGAGEVEAIPVISMELLHAGTLKDVVSRKGPISPLEAVDITLQIIAGLEAAHAAGVLHRDIKPANCFQDEDGMVKVGDFGLSISTLVKAEHSLTQCGTVLGTPAFAAPEQLRGEEVDARADIYAVGATLYYLLTGKPPFEDESLVALIANVLEKPPVDIGKRRQGIPAGLRAVVMRCLEKQRDKRFRDYAALRGTLLPYSSAAPTPGTIGLRFAAGLLDSLGFAIPTVLGLALLNYSPDTDWIGDRTATKFAWFVAFLVWYMGWFAIPEGLWGRSLGKQLCGLRVVRKNGNPIGMGAAWARALIFSYPEIVTPVVTAMVYSAERYSEASAQGEWLSTEWLSFALFVPLFLTMRRRNGFAAVHDLLTGTRVVEDDALELLAARAEPFAPEVANASAERIGPYVVTEHCGALVEAFDPALRRRVWILNQKETEPALSGRRRDITRPTRLRWLQGARSNSENWDAFDRPSGQPLMALNDGKESWKEARVWLADLADELHAGLAAGTLPAALSLSHVWITDSGRAVILDFPAPGAEESPARPIVNVEHVQQFLEAAATTAISPRMPLHARAFLTSLRERRFEAPAIVAGNLRAIVDRRATVHPRRRAMSVLLTFIVMLLCSAMIAAYVAAVRSHFDHWWAQAHAGKPSPRLELEVLSELVDKEKDPTGLSRHLASTYGEALIGDAFWEQLTAEELGANNLVLRPAVEPLIAYELGRLPPNAATHAVPPEVAELLKRQAIYQNSLVWPVIAAMHATATTCLIGVFIALIFRVSPMLRMFGFAVVRRDGERAGRWRMAMRTLFASLPVFAASIWLLAMERWFWSAEHSYYPYGIGVVVALFAFGVYGINSGRGLGERLSGTWIVPR